MQYSFLNLSPASFIHAPGCLAAAAHAPAGGAGEGPRRRLTCREGARPPALVLLDQATASSELALRPCLSASQTHGLLPLPTRTPSSHTSLLPSALARQHSHPPGRAFGQTTPFPQFSLDPGKTGCFVSPEAQLKHHHSREILPDYFLCWPVIHRAAIRTKAGSSSGPLLQVPPLGLPGGSCSRDSVLPTRAGIDSLVRGPEPMPTPRLSTTK